MGLASVVSRGAVINVGVSDMSIHYFATSNMSWMCDIAWKMAARRNETGGT